jgi:serine palmitoyltransferase
MLTGSMATGLGSGGGFCVGSTNVVMHQVRVSFLFLLQHPILPSLLLQRINSPGFVFSASLPPLLAVTASEAVSLLSLPLTSTDPRHPLSFLPGNVRAIRSVLDPLTTIEIPSAEISPVIHFSIRPSVIEAMHKAQSGAEGGRVTRARSHSNVSHPPALNAPGGISSGIAVRGISSEVEKRMEVEAAREEQEKLLQEIVDLAAENGVLLTTVKRNWAQEQADLRPRCVSSFPFLFSLVSLFNARY